VVIVVASLGSLLGLRVFCYSRFNERWCIGVVGLR
jgi:hypothetical protein